MCVCVCVCVSKVHIPSRFTAVHTCETGSSALTLKEFMCFGRNEMRGFGVFQTEQATKKVSNIKLFSLLFIEKKLTTYNEKVIDD